MMKRFSLTLISGIDGLFGHGIVEWTQWCIPLNLLAMGFATGV